MFNFSSSYRAPVKGLPLLVIRQMTTVYRLHERLLQPQVCNESSVEGSERCLQVLDLYNKKSTQNDTQSNHFTSFFFRETIKFFFFFT